MKRSSMLMTAIGLGAAYLMKNKDARDKLLSQVQNMKGQLTSKQKSPMQ